MIPNEYKEEIIATGIEFLTAIGSAYGPEQGMQLWEAIAATLDPDIKGEIFMAMLAGEGASGRVTVKQVGNKISAIKAFRNVDTRRLGLKEAKDLVDDLSFQGKYAVLHINSKNRTAVMRELRDAGCLL